MLTIGRRWPKDRECEDYVGVCAYCDTAYPRSRLHRDGTGQLRCHRHTWTDRVTATEMNQEGVDEDVGPTMADGGQYPKRTYVVTPIEDVIGDVTF